MSEPQRRGGESTGVKAVRIKPGTRLLAVLLAGWAFALVLLYVGIRTAGPGNTEVGIEFVNGGLQLAIVVIFGAVTSFAIKHFEGVREEARRLEEARTDAVRRVFSSYEAVKSARRTLRALGLRSCKRFRIARRQAEGYHAQMAALNSVQLAFERVKREARAFPAAFSNPRKVASAAQRVEKYVNKVIAEWEKKGSLVEAGGDFDVILGMPYLQDFIGRDSSNFRASISKSLDEIVAAVRTITTEEDERGDVPEAERRAGVGS